jgi:hypothetical protein
MPQTTRPSTLIMRFAKDHARSAEKGPFTDGGAATSPVLTNGIQSDFSGEFETPRRFA